MRLDLRLWCGAHVLYAHLLPSRSGQAHSNIIRKRRGAGRAQGPLQCRASRWGAAGADRWRRRAHSNEERHLSI